MEILVTGGAGYIGSALVKSLIEKKHNVGVIDNLSKGKKEYLHPKAKFYRTDLVDKKELAGNFKNSKFDAVIHLAAYKSVEESMKNPEKYKDNVVAANNLLELIEKHAIKKLIFSSTAAVYGTPQYSPLDENHSTKPINVYGQGKLEVEKNIMKVCEKNSVDYIILRYFNVAGDAGLNYIDPAPENVFPKLMDVVFGKRREFTIFGNDYKTRDGTCIRDYIDINDIVKAHILSLDVNSNNIMNIGTSNGISVLELVKSAEKVIEKKIPFKFGPRRAGDCPELVASNQLAKRIMKWKPEKSIDSMILSTYNAYKNRYNPRP